MTPEQQQSALARCLALQPLVGWPQWRVGARAEHRLIHRAGPERAYWLIEVLWTPDYCWSEAWCACETICLCIWQDHLLARLAERSGSAGDVSIDQFGNSETSKACWYVEVETASGTYSAYADTLIEALLDVWEQIQKGDTGDD